ncbi:MAG: phospholipase D family protein [Chromatiales bacterium]|jgi:putative cardiolipin synthase
MNTGSGLRAAAPGATTACLPLRLSPNKIALNGLTAVLLLLLFLLPLAGCSTLPTDYPRTYSQALEDPKQTKTGAKITRLAEQRPGKSGFAILRKGRGAFTSRIAMAGTAEKTLDLQYYIWEADTTGRILADRLLQAADRGVRVRLLLDDINLKGRDAIVAAMDAHENIEIRLFNPFSNRGIPALNFITDFNRVNHRMHNKMMVADNSVAILGGRNIGNHYFGVDTQANFRDLDIMAAGPVVRDISSVFDHFWNGKWSVPIAALVKEPQTEEDLQLVRESLREKIAAESYPYPLDQDVAELRSYLQSTRNALVWASGSVQWDDPAEIGKEGHTSGMVDALAERIGRLESELLIESAYFVPMEKGVASLGALVERNVKVRVLTNSLVSNDVLAAHSGYAESRKELVRSGVEVYELRPDAGIEDQKLFAGSSKAALHTKAMVFDRKDLFIGSLNLDPRSGLINTEIGLHVESPQLAAQVIEYMDEGVLPGNSYRVQLDADGKLEWVTETNGRTERYSKDPGSSFWQRFVSGFIAILPVEGQL